MLPLQERLLIRSLMRQEIIPAIGCTEPIAVLLMYSQSGRDEILNETPEKNDPLLEIS